MDLDLERGERGGRWELTETLPEFHKNQYYEDYNGDDEDDYEDDDDN